MSGGVYVEVFIPDADLPECVERHLTGEAAQALLAALETLHQEAHDHFPFRLCSRQPCVGAADALAFRFRSEAVKRAAS